MVEVFNFTKSRIDKKYFQKTGKVILKKLGQPKDVEIRTCSLRSRNLVSSLGSEISLAFVGDARMRGLNKKYRGIDKTTDVLSFDYGDIKIPPNLPLQKGGILPPPFAKSLSRIEYGKGWGGFLGEIVISVPQAKRQARERNYPLKVELTELFVHGILHLAGYEDETKKDYKIMVKKQEEILRILKLPQ